MSFIETLKGLANNIDQEDLREPPVKLSWGITKEQYANEIRRLRRHYEMRHSKRLPKEIYDYGWQIARTKPQRWMVQRVAFWAYAYDRKHHWQHQDFKYTINDEAWEKAKGMRKRRKELKAKYAKDKHNAPRPFTDLSNTTWDDCKGGFSGALKRLGFNSIEEAIGGNKRRNK